MKNFCAQPWVGLDITPQGEYKPCCKFSSVIADNLDDYNNSKLLKELQDYHNNDLRHPDCKRCWNDEDSGLISKRQLDNKFVFHEKLLDIDSGKINLLGLTFGNTCNLACRTCNTNSSSRWRKEIDEHGNFNNQVVYTHSKFYKDKKFFDDLLQMLDENLHIDLSGGEPLLTGTKEHLYFIKKLAKHGDNITLHYTTNTTNYPSDELLKLWTNFKKVDIQFSIDGIGDKLEYIRWPAEWNTIYEHIQKYKALATSNTNIQLSISHTLSIFNVLDLPQFLDWCEKESLPTPYIGMVSYPVEYNIKVLPQDIKTQITEVLGERCPSVISYMNSEDLSSDFTKTLSHIKFLDKVRKQQFTKTFADHPISRLF